MRLCVFCGSSTGLDPAFATSARLLAGEMVRRKIDLVYGGGNVGLMGVMADAVLEAGGRVTGVIPHALVAREIAHKGLTNLRVVHSMHERKALMADLSDGFIALPGGFGTLEEFCEAVTWTQLGLHAKPLRAAEREWLLRRAAAVLRTRAGRRAPQANPPPHCRRRFESGGAPRSHRALGPTGGDEMD